MLKRKIAQRNGVFQNDSVSEKDDGPKYGFRKRKKVTQEAPRLVGFSVAWRAHPQRGPAHISFRLNITATFSQPVDPDRIVYEQYTRDRMSIQAGTDPGNVQFTTTRFELDRYTADDQNGDVATTGVLTFQDNPGYTPIFNLDQTTDLHYTFGAYWRITLDGNLVLDTDPLYGVAMGAHHVFQVGNARLILVRLYRPRDANTATWNMANNTWQQTLNTLAPAWPQLPNGYPVPAVVDP